MPGSSPIGGTEGLRRPDPGVRPASAGPVRAGDRGRWAGWEAFGNVFAEALASGLPVIGSNVGGIPELIEHGVNGLLVTPGDPSSLARAIGYLASDIELRGAMSLRNRARAEATLDWSQATARYVTIYEGAMDQLPVPTLVSEPSLSAL